MSDPLRSAFDEAAKLPLAEQEAFAAFLLAELADEQQWRERFATSGSALSRLAAKAREEHARGKTQPLDDLLK